MILGLVTAAGAVAAETPAEARPPGAVAAAPAVAQANSRNWAGYVVRQAGLHKITAHYRVPTVDCAHLPPRALTYTNTSVWVGLDGGLAGGNTSIEQVGVDADCVGGNVPEYQAWWEMEGPGADTGSHDLPTATYPVLPGDFIKSAVDWDSGNTFTLTLINYGTATPATGPALWTFSRQVSLPPDDMPQLNSAEAVVERPVDIGQLLCLSNFGTVDFLRVKVNAEPLRDFDATSTALTLLQDTIDPNPPPGNVLATPGPVVPQAGDAFTVTWHAYGSPRGQ
ncbi:G1 family glutamic endopeptidase [Streptomyces sp. NBC_01477]|uniref:G1 family glutamic endopeptidase n=1 Tax=Streptomyces sp. NBC_01477 TaxID=2976015 RepID=UPI002E31234B|nr:G1 family glutamic endopeptidase [Streptomyces sp. NBC_01477]